jgi:hypothetical protein
MSRPFGAQNNRKIKRNRVLAVERHLAPLEQAIEAMLADTQE